MHNKYHIDIDRAQDYEIYSNFHKIQAHIKDTTVHITAEERSNWNDAVMKINQMVGSQEDIVHSSDLNNYYTKEYIDNQHYVSQSTLTNYYTKSQVDAALNTKEQSIKNYVANNYYNKTNSYTKTDLYTKTEVDDLISAISTGGGVVDGHHDSNTDFLSLENEDGSVVDIKLYIPREQQIEYVKILYQAINSSSSSALGNTWHEDPNDTGFGENLQYLWRKEIYAKSAQDYAAGIYIKVVSPFIFLKYAPGINTFVGVDHIESYFRTTTTNTTPSVTTDTWYNNIIVGNTQSPQYYNTIYCYLWRYDAYYDEDDQLLGNSNPVCIGVYGKPGEAGLQGSVIRSLGDWDEISNAQILCYRCNESGTTTGMTFTDVVRYNGHTYMFTHGDQIGTSQKSSITGNPSTSSMFIQADEYKFIVTEALIAKQAIIDSLQGETIYVYNGDPLDGADITGFFSGNSENTSGIILCGGATIDNTDPTHVTVDNAKFQFNSDGSGFIANKNIFWNKDGVLTVTGALDQSWINLTKDNYSNYVYRTSTSDTYEEWFDMKNLPIYTICDDSLDDQEDDQEDDSSGPWYDGGTAVLRLPGLYYNGTAWEDGIVGYHRSGNNFYELTTNDIRTLVGKQWIIVNDSGDTAIEIQGYMKNPGQSLVTSQSVTIVSGKMGILKCNVAAHNNHECVYWEVTDGGTFKNY